MKGLGNEKRYSDQKEMALRIYYYWKRKITESKTGWAAGTDEISIADLKLFTGLFGLFSGNYDGMDASIVSKYPGLIKYHDKVANEPRIKQYYDKVDSQDIRWTFLPGAFN